MEKNQIISIWLPLILFSNSCSIERTVDAVWLIPEDYLGVVGVYYDYENGQPPEYEGDSRVYRIPQSGVLKTQFSSNVWILSDKVYYLRKDSSRVEIPFFSLEQKDDEIVRIDTTKPYYIGNTHPSGSGQINYTDKTCILNPNSKIRITTGDTYRSWFDPYTYEIENEPVVCKEK
jgi:hypothetical protein